MFDLGPASDDLVRLVRGVRDDQLGGPTPCADWSLADLLAHVHQFATVFTANARKVPPAPVDGLPGDWRGRPPAPARRARAGVAGPVRLAGAGVRRRGGDDRRGERRGGHRGARRARLGRRPRERPGLRARRRSRWATSSGSSTCSPGRSRPGRAPTGRRHRGADATRLDRYLAAAGRDPAWSPVLVADDRLGRTWSR